MFASLLYISLMIVVCFWFVQVCDLLFRELRYFESHTHKLTWFLVLIIGNIIGAVWYFVWKRKAAK